MPADVINVDNILGLELIDWEHLRVFCKSHASVRHSLVALGKWGRSRQYKVVTRNTDCLLGTFSHLPQKMSLTATPFSTYAKNVIDCNPAAAFLDFDAGISVVDLDDIEVNNEIRQRCAKTGLDCD